MSRWPMSVSIAEGVLELPAPGRYALIERDEDKMESLTTRLIVAARAGVGGYGVGWIPENGGLLGNLPAWENLLLATQWHAPSSIPAVEKRVREWFARIGYEDAELDRLMPRQPAFLGEDDRRLVGWFREMLTRPRLVVIRAHALDIERNQAAFDALLDEELASAAILSIDEICPAGFGRLTLLTPEDSAP